MKHKLDIVKAGIFSRLLVKKDLLPATYVTKERGKIVVKGKGEMVTFWMESKTGRAPPPKDEVMSNLETMKQAQKSSMSGPAA